LKAQLNEPRYRVTIGSQVTWYPKSERWRIEVAGSLTMQAVFIKHCILAGITEVDSDDPKVVAGLVQIHREAIEEAIGVAETENWPDRLGVLPQRFEVVSMAALRSNADFE
jgi:hypothetical protein